MRRMVREAVWLSLQSWASTVAIADPDSITFFTEEQKDKARAVYVGATNMMEWAAKYDVKIYAGTDMYFHAYVPDVTDDLIARLPWFTPVEILKHNTSNAGRALSETTLMNPYKEGKLGVIEKGAYADLLIIDGNPLADLGVLKELGKLKLIMKDGKVHKNSL